MHSILFKKATIEEFSMFKANTVICILAPEISLKSAKVRERLEAIAKENIIKYLKANQIVFSNVFLRSARIFIETEETTKVVKILANCFGVFALIQAQKDSVIELENICENCALLCKGIIKDTFAVRCKSFNKRIKSRDVEMKAGSKILDAFTTKVNLSAPKTQINALVFEKQVFYYFDSIPGARGMPVGAQGTIVLIGKDKTNSEKLAKKLLRTGCRVKLIADFDLNLEEFNAMEKIQKITLEEIAKLKRNDKINAIFSDSTNLEERSKIDDLVNEKTFAPLLCLA